MIKVAAAVVRDGKSEEISFAHLVPGDVMTLSAGNAIPADVRVIATKDLFRYVVGPDRRRSRVEERGVRTRRRGAARPLPGTPPSARRAPSRCPL